MISTKRDFAARTARILLLFNAWFEASFSGMAKQAFIVALLWSMGQYVKLLLELNISKLKDIYLLSKGVTQETLERGKCQNHEWLTHSVTNTTYRASCDAKQRSLKKRRENWDWERPPCHLILIMFTRGRTCYSGEEVSSEFITCRARSQKASMASHHHHHCFSKTCDHDHPCCSKTCDHDHPARCFLPWFSLNPALSSQTWTVI